MKRFDSLYEAAEYAAARSSGWGFAHSDERYDRDSLLVIARASDEENPAGGGSFYVASPGGAIGFCEDGGEIDWLFLPIPDRGEDLPAAFGAAQAGACPKCGATRAQSARFCGKCGARL